MFYLRWPYVSLDAFIVPSLKKERQHINDNRKHHSVKPAKVKVPKRQRHWRGKGGFNG